MDTKRRYLASISIVMIAAVMAFLSTTATAQVTTASLSGTVYDNSGAVVPGANVSLKNEASGDTRRTVANGEGYFTFAAVPPGSYTVSVEMNGFNKWEGKGVVLNSGDTRSVTGVKLAPGAANETITVEAAASQITPVDSGEKSTLITQDIIQNVAIVGQNAAEFIKIMPGMAFTGGTLNQSSYAAQDERTGNGPVGSFSANGTRTAALDITSDGAHIIDPGCNCGQAMNTNADMTQELKVMASNFGADEAKGPVTITSIGKSGGQQFHGEAYTYNRYYALNANDWLYNDKGFYPNGKQVLPRPETKYFYPGFNIGGPVIIPGTDFNRNRNKLFFFFGTEYYKQNVDNGVYEAAVPTLAMRNGNFTELASNPANAAGCPDTDPTHTGTNPAPPGMVYVPGYPTENCYTHNLNGSAITGLPGGASYTSGVINPGAIDLNGQRLMNTYPLPNLDPSLAAAQGFNYVNGQTRYSNMLQFRGRVDYNFSDSTKLYVSYNHQHDSAQESLDTLWTGSGQSWASPTTPYPSPLIETTTSDVVTANLTKVISPTLTNELVFSYVYLNLPNHFQDINKVDRGGLGLDYNLLFNHPNPDKLIFPQMTGWGDGISNQLNAGFELGGVVFAKKTLPSVADNVVKVWGTHTSKFGFYWERAWNQQPGNGNVNGTAIFSNWGSNSSGNAYADMLIGQTTQYNETNFDVTPAFRYLSEEFYGQDSWKVSRRLTVDYGLRVSHLGPWTDVTGYGFAAFYPNLYASGIGASFGTPPNQIPFPGIEWHKVNPSTPLSGSSSRLFFYNPRAGFAWDIFGTGKTVLRGGYGMYHFHDEQNVQNGAYGIVRGSFSSPTLWSPTLASLGPSLATLQAPSGVNVLDPKDDQEPRTQSYSLTVAQRTPWKSVLEVSYVGSKSDYLSNYNNAIDEINYTPVTGLFNAAVCNGGSGGGANPNNNNGIGNVVCGWLPNCDPTVTSGGTSCYSPSGNYTTGYTTSGPGGQVQAARPFQPYGTVKEIDHRMYSNYNSLQLSWNKQAGRFNFLANYTYSKALGIRGESGAGGGNTSGDPFNLRNDYGTLPNNRTHIFNVAYVYQAPGITNGNKFVRGAVNGWQVSGIVQYQTGSDLQAAVTRNFGYSAFIPAGTTFMGVTTLAPIQATNSNIIGSTDVQLYPKVICNPGKGLASHQYVNGNCFAPFATPGQQGTYIFPTLTGPSFFNTDLSVFKNFTFGQSESKKLTFRFSGYNFLNHPITTFINGDPGLTLTFDNTGKLLQNGGTTFGTAANKTGHRILQGELKFSW